MTHAYPRALRGPAAQDVTLLVAWLAVFFLEDQGRFRACLLVAIPVVLVWGVVTLHFPSRVRVDEEGVVFSRYGRLHRFEWSRVRRVRVRRFLVRDRVFVRLEPSPAWRGRYWILESIDGFEALVAALRR